MNITLFIVTNIFWRGLNEESYEFQLLAKSFDLNVQGWFNTCFISCHSQEREVATVKHQSINHKTNCIKKNTMSRTYVFLKCNLKSTYRTPAATKKFQPIPKTENPRSQLNNKTWVVCALPFTISCTTIGILIPQ